MDSKTPYLTLAAVACVFVGLLVVNQVAASGDESGSGDEYGAGASQTPEDEGETEADETEADETEAEADENENEADENENEGDENQGGSPFPHRVVYAGRTAKDGPALAVAILGDEAAGYFCDGVSVEAWMKGKADDDGEVSLRGSHSANVEARLRGSMLVGTVEAGDDSGTYRFKIPAAEPPAGLYRADGSDGDTTIGWIVLPDGSQVGIVNAEDETQPAPELTPGESVEVQGQSLEPSAVQGDVDF